MQLTDIALRSLRRRLGRMALLVLGLAVGVATVVTLVAITGAMNQAIAVRLDEYGANILIVPRADDLSLSYGGITVASASYDVGQMTLTDLERIQTIPNARNVSVVAPKLLHAVLIDGRQVLLAGIQFADELRLKQWWQVQGATPVARDDVLVGALLAHTLGAAQGDVLTVEGRSLRVAGVLAENGSQDDHILFVDLGLAQEILARPNQITLAEVAALCNECPIEEMVAQISTALPQARVTALRQAVGLRMDTVDQLTRFAVAVSGVVAVIGGLVVLMTMLGSVAERRQEIGLFRALGFRRTHIARVILSEAGAVSLVGGLIGWLAGMVAAVLLRPSVAEMADAVAWNPWLAAGAISGALAIGLLGSLYPAVRAAQLDPATALRAL